MKAIDVKTKLMDLGADLCGIASVDRFNEAPEGFHPRDVLPGCRSVIAFAKRFPVGTLACPTTVPYTIVRNRLSEQIDHLSVAFSVWMEAQGEFCVPTGAISHNQYDAQTGRWRSIISAKHSAAAAGLGRIGRNTLLVNPQFGNMIWLGAMPTTALLEADAPLTGSPCPRHCTLCVTRCPAGALDSLQMDQQACHAHAFRTEPGEEFQFRCHLCRSVCPNRFGSENTVLQNLVEHDTSAGRSSAGLRRPDLPICRQ